LPVETAPRLLRAIDDRDNTAWADLFDKQLFERIVR